MTVEAIIIKAMEAMEASGTATTDADEMPSRGG